MPVNNRCFDLIRSLFIHKDGDQFQTKRNSGSNTAAGGNVSVCHNTFFFRSYGPVQSAFTSRITGSFLFPFEQSRPPNTVGAAQIAASLPPLLNSI